MTQKKAWFEVDHKGMRELHSGRESWQLIKELVSNSFDEESVTDCVVVLKSKTGRTAELTVYDNGKGFADIKDAWTLMAHTPKRDKPTVRGRFNIGEKELLCTAQSATILTSGYRISFSDSGRRVVKANTIGTTIKATLYLGSRQVETAIGMLKQILPPKNIHYSINGIYVLYKAPDVTTEATLETVLWKDNIESHPRRKTEIEIYRNDNWLYEMGIPVQKLECDYGINVIQKIPMPPNRDVVKDKYLQGIYTLVLNTMSEEIETPSATWVHTAMEDKEVTPEAIKNVIEKRYEGKPIVLWSNNPKANDKAQLEGYEVVHGKTLSSDERENLQTLGGIKYSGEAFPSSFKSVDKIPLEKWSSSMNHIANYAKYLHNLIGLGNLVVEYISDMEIRAMATYQTGWLTFNKFHCGNSFFDKITPDVTGLLLHEFAHNVSDLNSEHSPRWYDELQRLSGLAVHYATKDKKLRNYIGG